MHALLLALALASSPHADVALHTTSAESSSPTWGSVYVINDTYALYFATDLPKSLEGQHSTLNLEVFDPSGPYIAYDVPFAAGVPAASGEQQAEVIRGGYRVWVSMPVAGTWIQQYSLVGTWTASAYLPGLPAANTAFTLE